MICKRRAGLVCDNVRIGFVVIVRFRIPMLYGLAKASKSRWWVDVHQSYGACHRRVRGGHLWYQKKLTATRSVRSEAAL